MRIDRKLPPQVVPIFWGLFFLEATFGAYLSVWQLWIERLGAPVTVVGIVLGAGGFVRLLVLIPSAGIADRFGYRRTILGCRMLAAMGLISAAFATHWTHLIVMVVLSAAGELVFPLLQVLVAALAGDQRIRAFAIVFTVGPSMALIISPLIAGGLVALFGIRAAFLFGALTTIISLFFLARIQEPEGLRHHEGSVQSTYRDALREPSVRLIGSLLLVTVFSLSLGVALVPTFLEDVRGMAAAVITTVAALAAVGSATFGLAVARWRKLQRSPFFAVGLAVVSSMIALIIFRTAALFPLIAIGFYFRGGLFSAWAMLSAALGEVAPARHRARAFAICEMCGGIGFSMGPIVAGPLYAQSEFLPFNVSLILSACLLPVLFVAQRRAHRLRAETETEC